MHLHREPDKPDRISWVVDVISMWFNKFQSEILSRVTDLGKDIAVHEDHAENRLVMIGLGEDLIFHVEYA